MKSISCGIIVTDGERLLLGHATRSPRWDIPKGMVEAGETLVAAARRELFEETGLEAREEELQALGTFPYLRDKDLALFVWRPASLPDPATLACSSQFIWNGRTLPEFDRFGFFPADEALTKVGKSLAALLRPIFANGLEGASV